MFSEEQVKQYKNITAPSEMRERVLSSAKKQRKINPMKIYECAGFVACIAVIIAFSLVLGSFSGTTVTFNGQILSEGPVALPAAAAASARAASGITIDADLGRSSTITVSEGRFDVYDRETGELSERKTYNNEVTIVWDIVPTDTSETYTLIIENSRGITEIILLFNEMVGWQLTGIEK